MRILSHNEDRDHDEYVVRLDEERLAFLTVRKRSHPVRVDAGSCAGCLGTDEEASSVREASDWLVEEIRAGRAVRDGGG